MFEIPEKKLYVTDTIFRDAHQSLAATRMRIDDMLPACKILDDIGFWSLECWGGATFDTCLRFLDEDPWERLRVLKKNLPKTRLQMLLRGQNLLGYRNYPDDVVDEFCKASIENGIDVVRVFDALNDVRNLETSIKCVKKYGAICEATICYTKSPIHNNKYFTDMAIQLEKMGADVICIKDMANLLLPNEAYELVTDLKSNIDLPIHLHTHNTTGTGSMVYLMAAMAGVDIIDCALSPFANGTSQPATESIVAAFKDTPRSTELDLSKLSEAASVMQPVLQRMQTDGTIDYKVYKVDSNVLTYQVPGGMISNLLSQLRQMGAEDRLNDVLQEVPKVRKDFGYPPLVTPTSQIVGAQAVINILSGNRYSMFPVESKMLLKGQYGKLPGKVNEEVIKMALGNEDVITCRPADLLNGEMHELREKYKDITQSTEEILSLALYPKEALKFLNSHSKDNDDIKEIYVDWLQE